MSSQTSAIPTVAELYQTYGRRVFNLAYRMTGNRATAEDVLQEVFLRVMEHAHSFRGESSIYSWIFTIARNVCLKSKKRSFRVIEKLIEQEGKPPKETDFENDLERRYYIQQVKDGCLTGLLACLSFHQRLAFILGALYQVPIKTIARILKRSENSVRILISRAKANLKAFLCSNCSVYKSDNRCRCQNMIHFSVRNGWVARYGAAASPAVIQSELKELRSEVLLYQSLLEQDPPPRWQPLASPKNLKILSPGKVK